MGAAMFFVFLPCLVTIDGAIFFFFSEEVETNSIWQQSYPTVAFSVRTYGNSLNKTHLKLLQEGFNSKVEPQKILGILIFLFFVLSVGQV